MEIKIKLEDLRELNKIRGMMESSDFNTQNLGYDLFVEHPVIKQLFYGFEYMSAPNKWIPLQWYFRKASELKKDFLSSEEGFKYPEHVHLVVPILQSIIELQPKFRTCIYFSISKDE